VLEMVSGVSQENPVHNAGRAGRIPHARVNGLSSFLAPRLICCVQIFSHSRSSFNSVNVARKNGLAIRLRATKSRTSATTKCAPAVANAVHTHEIPTALAILPTLNGVGASPIMKSFSRQRMQPIGLPQAYFK
jgi:hypothetical protein